MKAPPEEIFCFNEGIFTEINRVMGLENEPHSIKIAVAYFGARASKYVAFRPGCTLIVNLSLDNMLSGSVDPAEVKKVMNAGVRVEACDGLHAKVVLTTGYAVVGSANFSKNAHDHLSEAAISTNNPDVRNHVADFIRDLPGRYVLSHAFVDFCIETSSQMRRESAALKKQNKIPTMQAWVLNTVDEEPDSDTAPTANQYLGTILDMSGKRKFDYVHYSIDDAKRHLNGISVGDIFFDARRSDDEGSVLWKHRKICRIETIKEKKSERVYLYFETHNDSDRRDLISAQSALRDLIPDLGGPKKAIKLSLAQMNGILGLWDDLLPPKYSAA